MKAENFLRHQYDAILIGSGIGALTVASLMAQLRNQKVLVLERHFNPGGLTQDFRRDQFHWNVDAQGVGSMSKDCAERALMDLVTGGKVQWARLPDPTNVYVYPDFQFSVWGSAERYRADLVNRFPTEAPAIRRYFRDLSNTYAHGYPAHTMKQCRSFPTAFMGRLASLRHRSWVHWTVKDYLDKSFKRKELKAIIASQWVDIGLPPSLCSFSVFATVMHQYVEGAYYPVGGAGTIAASVQQIVEAKGGKFLLNREVARLLIRNHRAVGVRVRKVHANAGSVADYFAPVIVSDAGAATTYLKLVPPAYPIPFRESLRRFTVQMEPTTTINVYLGLSQDPRKLGFKGENYWIHTSLDCEDTYKSRKEWIENLTPVQAYVSFPSLNDPQSTSHTAEIVAQADYNVFSKWRNQPWLHRDDEYQSLKAKLIDALIKFVDQHLPGLADIVKYAELSTPITSEHFTGHYHGALHGLPAVPERYRQENLVWTRPTTVVPGLYLTGVDVHCPGVVGAMTSATFTVGELPNGISRSELKSAVQSKKENL